MVARVGFLRLKVSTAGPVFLRRLIGREFDSHHGVLAQTARKLGVRGSTGRSHHRYVGALPPTEITPQHPDATRMSDLVLIPFPGLGTLALSKEQFDAALAAGNALSRGSAPSVAAPSEELVDAESLERRTGVPASWWMAQARKGCIPFRKIGRRVRFDAHEVIHSEVFLGRQMEPRAAIARSAREPKSTSSR
jgi:hypothetical protein